VAPATLALMTRMVEAGEADALVPERVWQEISRGLMERSPARMLAVLRECGALGRVLPELDETFADPQVPERMSGRLERAAAAGFALTVRYALLVLDLRADNAAVLSERINAPADCREAARLAIQERDLLSAAPALDVETTLGLLERADAFRRPERIDRLLDVAECDAPVEAARVPAIRASIARALAAARSVDAGAIAREHPEDIPGAIRRARLAAIAGLQAPTGH
jgi:tRNA nucleotidyltransferase (CCA-adding enzyme)